MPSSSTRGLTPLQQYEEAIDKRSCPWVIGADECGWGAWAGPLVVCAAVVRRGWHLAGVDDSKELTPKQRAALFPTLQAQVAHVVDFTYPAELDVLGMAPSLREAYRRAVAPLHARYPEALIVLDGTQQHLEVPHLCFPKADGLVPAVMAASVLGKVTRDREMVEWDALHPGYNFAKNAGYAGSATHAHNLGLERLGVSPIHRRCFAPIQKLLAK